MGSLRGSAERSRPDTVFQTQATARSSRTRATTAPGGKVAIEARGNSGPSGMERARAPERNTTTERQTASTNRDQGPLAPSAQAEPGQRDAGTTGDHANQARASRWRTRHREPATAPSTEDQFRDRKRTRAGGAGQQPQSRRPRGCAGRLRLRTAGTCGAWVLPAGSPHRTGNRRAARWNRTMRMTVQGPRKRRAAAARVNRQTTDAEFARQRSTNARGRGTRSTDHSVDGEAVEEPVAADRNVNTTAPGTHQENTPER